MSLSIPAKFFLAILAACALVLVVNNLMARSAFERNFLGYLNDQGVERMREVMPRIEDGYRRNGSWEFVRGHPEVWFTMLRLRRGDGTPMPAVPPVSDQTGAVPRLALLDAAGLRVIGNASAGPDAIRLPVQIDGRTVGWLAMVPFQQAIAAGDRRFYLALVRAWWTNGIVSALVAALLAALLSRALLARVGVLTQEIHRLADGDYTTRIDVAGNDEFGRLAQDVNRLAATLDGIERNRRAFMSDISHELRTPLAVLRAELEAIQDGIRPMSPATLAPLQAQVRQLGKLIDDLYELAMTRTGEVSYSFTRMDIGDLLQTAAAGMRHRFTEAGLQLRAEPAGEALWVDADERRMQQVFANLLENSLRYTQRGGLVTASARRDGAEVEVVIEDSAPGVPTDKVERVFERFYRVEGSRNRDSGGSGLGLAICRNIVQAHGGKIRAEASPLGGLRVVLRLGARV